LIYFMIKNINLFFFSIYLYIIFIALDDPIEKKSKKNNGGVTADAQNIALLVDMGFNSTKVEKALIETVRYILLIINKWLIYKFINKFKNICTYVFKYRINNIWFWYILE